MSNKKILILGTAAPGGIQSVIEAYDAAGFYSPRRARRIATHKEGGLLKRVVTAWRAYLVVVGLLITSRVALLHLHMSMRGSFWRKALFLLLGRAGRVPVIIHLHGSEFEVFYHESPAWIKKVIRGVFDRANAVVVLSESWGEFVSGLTRTKVVVIGNFVPDHYDPARAATGRNHRALLFLGQFGARKGIYDLIPAFAKVLDSVPEAHLYCGGNGEVEQVRALIKELHLENSVHVPGWVSGGEKTALLHKCGTFVLPSYNEGLPMAIIEAMSYGMAIVSTRVGGIPELVDESNGTLVDPGDHEALRTALVMLLKKDQKSVEVMGEASREKYSRLFSGEACLAEMRALYSSLGVTP